MHPTANTPRLLESWLRERSTNGRAESDESLHRIVESKLCLFYSSLGLDSFYNVVIRCQRLHFALQNYNFFLKYANLFAKMDWIMQVWTKIGT